MPPRVSPLRGCTFHLVDSFEKAGEFMRWLGERHENDAVAFDTETTGLSPYEPGGNVRLAQFGDTRQGWAIPWEDWRGLIQQALAQWDDALVLHHSKFDVNWVETHAPGLKIKRHNLHDTMIQARIVDPQGSGALKTLSDIHIDRAASHGQTVLHDAMKANNWTWATVPINNPAYWAYGCLDTVITAHLHGLFYPKMRPGTEFAAVYDLEMAVSDILGSMERRGARVDVDYCRKMEQYLIDRGQQIREWGQKEHGISVGSGPQLASRFAGMGVEIINTTPTGAPKIDKWQLQIIADPDNAAPFAAQQLAALALEMRQAEKTGNTYFKNFADMAIDGIVHPSIHTIGARTGRMSVSSPALQQCVDGATEILTPEGWIRFDRLPDGMQVAQYDTETGDVSFVVPERIIRQPYERPLHTLTLWGRTFAYTADHRVVSYARDRSRGGLVTKIEDASTWHAELAVGGLGDRKFARAGHVVGGRRLTAPERASLRLAVIAQADGNLRVDMAKDAYEVSVSKSRKVEALRACGIPLRTTYGRGKRPDRQRGWILREQVSEWLDDSKEKNFLSSILRLSEDDLRWFIDEILFWDGDFTRGASYSQSVKRERSIDIVQAAAALCGYSTSSFFRDEGDGAIQLNLNPREHRGYGAGTGEVGYMSAPDGMVYCATVPTGAIVTRREGLVLITGNCPKRDATVRNAFIPREGNALVTSDFSQIEMRMVAHFSGDEDMISTFNTADATGSDFFTEMGRLIYDPRFVKTDKRRGLIKSSLYGMAYGAGASTMAETAGVPVEKMKLVISDIETRFPGIRSYMKAVELTGKRRERDEGQGYIHTRLGRKLTCDSGKVYTLTNYSIQGGAAELFKEGLVRMDMAGYRDWMILPVHDEIVLDMPREFAADAVVEVPELLADRSLSVPITADADGPWESWGAKYE